MPDYMKAVLLAALGLAAAAAVLVALSPVLMRPPRSMLLDRVLGTVTCYQRTRLPWLQCAVVTYARRGRPYQGTTLPMFSRQLPRIGAKRPFLLYKLPKKTGPGAYWLGIPKSKTT